MRRETWILAISGMMALHQSGLAADPTADQTSGPPAAGSARTSRNPTANRPVKTTDARPKNYYKDLFGEEGPASPTIVKQVVPASTSTALPSHMDTADWAADSHVEVNEIRPKSAPKKTENRFGLEPALTDLPVKAGQSSLNATDKTKAQPEKKVSQAAYNRPAGKPVPVQQIRSESRPRSAPPISDFEDAPRTTASATANKTVPAPQDPFDFEPDVAFPSSRVNPSRQNVSRLNTPTEEIGPQTPQVTVEWSKRGEFNVGQECLVDLIVRNAGTTAVSQVAIDAIFPTNVRLTAAEPRPASATDRLTWTFDQLAPASEQKITIKLIPSSRGDIGATAQVRFTGVSSAAFAVQEPMLKIAMKAPTKEIMLGDPASQMITITNPGTGTALDVKLEAKLSEGLEHTTREDHLVIDIGSIGPSETRTYRLGLTAAKGGPQTVNVTATSSSEASSSASVKFNVVAPSLKIAVEGPSLRYRGRNAKYALIVTNDGSLTNSNVRISQVVAEGFKFVSADHGGKFDAATRSIQWFIDRLETGESVQVGCELNSFQIGEFSHTAQVVSDSGVQAEARIDTRVDGIASLTMELVDLDDPVETGSETAYEIRVKNDGSKGATGVTLTCELPAGMELISAKSPVDRVVEGRQLTFKPIDQIAPGTQVTYRIHMKVNQDGSHRLRARLSGGGLTEPMVLEEVTRAYSDHAN